MLSPTRKQYLLIDKRCRRYSAPDDLRSGFARAYLSEESEDESRRSKVSIIDLSILFEDQSGSDSSLELDTSVSRDVSPLPDPVLLPSELYEYRKIKDGVEIREILFSTVSWKSVLISQLMSICVSFIDWTVEKLNETKNPLSANAQSLLFYIFLGIVWTPQLALRGSGRGLFKVLRLSGLRYILLAALHVETITLAISSLRHDSYIGNQMIDCVASSLSFIIAYVCLDVKFRQTHVVGFVIAFTGALGMCAANTNQSSEDDDVTWGDILRFGSGLFLAFNSLAQELIVKSIDTVEYLGMIGLLGSFLCGIQTIAIDKEELIPKECKYWQSLIVYSIIQFIFACLAPRILRDVGSTGLHLALITSTFYNHIIQCLLQQTVFQNLFLMSFLLNIIGLYIFILKRTSIGKHYFYPVQVTLSSHDN